MSETCSPSSEDQRSSGSARVVLINPKATYADEIAQKCFPPLGLLYLASALHASEIHVEVIDANALRLDDARTVERVRAAAPDLVGMPIHAETLRASAGTLRAIRAALPRVALVAGGPQASAVQAWMLAQIPELDYVLAGEGERSLVQLARCLKSGAPTSGIDGLVARAAPGQGSEPARIRDLDEVSFPARWAVREVYDKRLYYALLVPDRRIDCIVTSRGCPFRCGFCFNASRKVRFRSIDRCFEEIEQLRKSGVRTVEILDDNFASSADRAMEFFDRLAREQRGLAYRIKARADSITPKLVDAARRAGVYQVSIGAESGAPELLAAMDKRITVQQLLHASQLILSRGINCHTNWIIGYPGETPDTLSKTLALVREMKPTTAGFTILTPYPGTPVYEAAQREGTLMGEWSAQSAAGPWVRLSWTRSYEDLVAARRAMMRKVYLRPHYAFEYAKRIVGGANLTLARYAAQELRRAIAGRLRRRDEGGARAP